MTDGGKVTGAFAFTGKFDVNWRIMDPPRIHTVDSFTEVEFPVEIPNGPGLRY